MINLNHLRVSHYYGHACLPSTDVYPTLVVMIQQALQVRVYICLLFVGTWMNSYAFLFYLFVSIARLLPTLNFSSFQWPHCSFVACGPGAPSQGVPGTHQGHHCTGLQWQALATVTMATVHSLSWNQWSTVLCESISEDLICVLHFLVLSLLTWN